MIKVTFNLLTAFLLCDRQLHDKMTGGKVVRLLTTLPCFRKYKQLQKSWVTENYTRSLCINYSKCIT